MICVIAEKRIATIFRFAGIKAFYVKSEEEAKQKFDELKNKFEAIIIQDEFVKKILKERKENFPLIISIPSFNKKTENYRKYLYEKISKAIGAKLKYEWNRKNFKGRRKLWENFKGS